MSGKEYCTYDSGNIIAFNQRGQNEIEYDTSALVWGKFEQFYRVVNGKIEPKTIQEVEAIQAAFLADAIAEKERIDAIEQAKKTSGFKTAPLDTAINYIDAQFDTTGLDQKGALLNAFSGGTPDELKDLIYQVLLELRKLNNNAKAAHLKEMPYILRPIR